MRVHDLKDKKERKISNTSEERKRENWQQDRGFCNEELKWEYERAHH